MSEILRLDALAKTYGAGDAALHVLRGANLSLVEGEIVALIAPSGAGKSTLLHVAGLLDHPERGDVFVNGQSTRKLSDPERTCLRRDMIGFVYQSHHLLMEFTALENVVLPQMIAMVPQAKAEARAIQLLKAFGLGHRIQHLPGKMSGGERQRVAIARALANSPKLLLADEPTGNLDVATAQKVFEELLRAVRAQKLAALIATHNPEIAAQMDRRVVLRDGLLNAA